MFGGLTDGIFRFAAALSSLDCALKRLNVWHRPPTNCARIFAYALWSPNYKSAIWLSSSQGRFLSQPLRWIKKIFLVVASHFNGLIRGQVTLCRRFYRHQTNDTWSFLLANHSYVFFLIETGSFMADETGAWSVIALLIWLWFDLCHELKWLLRGLVVLTVQLRHGKNVTNEKNAKSRHKVNEGCTFFNASAVKSPHDLTNKEGWGCYVGESKNDHKILETLPFF